MQKNCLVLLLLSCLPHLAGAQNATAQPSLAVLLFEADAEPPGISAMLAQLRAEALKIMLRSRQFAIVERERVAALETERELQKAESFLDGKTVEQSKAVGADFLLSGFFEAEKAALTLKIIDVRQAAVAASSICDLREDLLPDGKALRLRDTGIKKMRGVLAEMLSQRAAQMRFPLLRVLEEKGDKARLVLVAGGSAKGLKKGMDLEVFVLETEDVDGVFLERAMVVGRLSVELVENANFSQAKITDGAKTLKQLLADGKKVYCRVAISKE